MKQVFFTTRQLIEKEINKTVTKNTGRSIVSICLRFLHVHILDAQKVVDDLVKSGKIEIRDNQIYKA